ncbi:MAG: hypothetical protein K8T26_17145 [Lentisphaerae bacterium]|nr:hypothetical protein [Lentisphaerota bacterium]
MTKPLACSAVTHAHIKPLIHPRLGVTVDGRATVRYLRFRRRVRIDHLELLRLAAGRWEPSVPTHPAHVTVSVLEGATWRVVKDVEFPPDPRVSGDGIDRTTSPEEMNRRFAPTLTEPLRIDLAGLETDHLRVECDREHPVWPNHGDCATGAAGHAVPFAILNKLTAHGEELEAAPDSSIYYQPVLKVRGCTPRAPRGMRVRRHLHSVVFEGKHLSVAFSLRRPILTQLGWDAGGFGQAGRNRIVTRRLDAFLSPNSATGASGPVVRTSAIDCSASHWTGEVGIRGNRVSYRNLACSAGVRLDAVFTIEPKRIVMELTQYADRDTVVLEAEAWRLAWDLKKGMTATAAVPTRRTGRAGDVQLPAMFASDAVGCLSCRVLEGPARLQVESYRDGAVNIDGIVLASVAGPHAPLVVSRKPVRAVVELTVSNLQPAVTNTRATIPPALRKHWASLYSNFRAEYAGFSNHGASTNCHVNQHGCIDLCAFTARPKIGPNPLDLARFTIERGLLDGSGYGYWRNLYLDADPILLSAVGRIHQADPDATWLKHVRPGLVETAQRLLATIGPEGLAVCHDLSGNSGTHRWSSNACDVVGFGHLDAYVNAWTYRALRNGAALLKETGDAELAARCRTTADGMPRPFAELLVNPKTGWVAGWRSRDGQLHDAAYVWVNGFACAFGVLEPRFARRALARLEALRIKMGLTDCPLGVPINLWPIPEADQPRNVSEGATAAQLELFCNGSVWPGSMHYYLRALSSHGFKANARKLSRDLEEGFLTDVMSPGMSEGAEFFSWDGMACGYEGTFVMNFSVMAALAIQRGLITPPDPEWWPAGG